MAVKEKKIVRAAAPVELPEGWRRVKFGDVVRDVKVTVDPETSGLRRYVAGEHMETDDLHIRRWGTIGEGYLGPAFHRKFVKGQVLYGSRRTYLRKVAVAEFDGICANTTFVLEPKGDEVLPELLPFVMQTHSFNTHAVKQSKGSVNPYVNWKDIAWYELVLPPKEEQRRIAEILWAEDASRERWRTVLNVFDKLQNNYLSNAMQLGNQIEFGKVVRLTSGTTKPHGKHFPFSVEYPLPIYGGNGIIGYTNQLLVAEPTVIIGRVGEYCGCVYRNEGPCWVSDNALYIRELLKPIDLGFLYYAMIHANFNRLKKSAGQPLVTQQQIYETVFFLPDVEVQKEIATTMDKLTEKRNRIFKHIETSHNLKKHLLAELLDYVQ